MDNIEKRADVGCAPYAGSGKLTDYREDGSWVMNQIDKGYENCDRGIRVNKPEDGGNIRFSSVQSRIASLITASAKQKGSEICFDLAFAFLTPLATAPILPFSTVNIVNILSLSL